MVVKLMLVLVYQYIPDLCMPLRKNHKLGFTRENLLDKTPICFKGRQGQKEKLSTIPNWQEKLRDLVDVLINQEKSP
jgi:hypothetical protein